jgi:hypothetical protein
VRRLEALEPPDPPPKRVWAPGVQRVPPVRAPSESARAELVDAQQVYQELQLLAEHARVSRNAAIRGALAAGASQLQIAEVTGISRARIGQIVGGAPDSRRTAAGSAARARRQHELISARDLRLCELRQQGASVTTLAKRFGLSEPRVYQIIHAEAEHRAHVGQIVDGAGDDRS